MVIPYVSICSGIEAFSVAVEPMPEFVPVAFSEIEAFPSKVLAHWWPDVPNLGDFTKIDPTRLGHVGWFVGGTPCQSFSVAGLRKGLNDDRGNLTLEYVRLAHALQENNGLRGALWENVPGALSDKTNAFGCFLGAIVGADGPLYPGDKPRRGRSTDTWRWVRPRERIELLDDDGEPTGEFEQATEGYHRPRWPDAGMVAGPRARAAWRILDSQHFGVPQRRRRVFVVLDFGNGPDPAAVLFEPRSQVGGAETGGTAGQEIAGTLASRATGGGGLGTDMDLAGGLQVAPPVSQMNSRTGNERNETENLIAHTLRGEGFDASEDGTGRGTPLVVAEYAGNAEGGNPEVPSLNASNGKKGINNQTGLIMVSEIAPTLRAGGNNTGGDRPPGSDVDTVESLVVMTAPAVAFNLRGREGGNMPELGTDQASALRSAEGGSSAPMVLAAQVRRLTPTECERLQGYPDGHTLIPGLSGWRDVGADEDVAELEAAGLTVRKTKTGKARVNDPDGPRYKALGNSFTVEPVNWIMSRARASMAGEPMPYWQPLRLWAKGRS